MPRPKRAEPPILAMLEKAFCQVSQEGQATFPYDATDQRDPSATDIEAEYRQLVFDWARESRAVKARAPTGLAQGARFKRRPRSMASATWFDKIQENERLPPTKV